MGIKTGSVWSNSHNMFDATCGFGKYMGLVDTNRTAMGEMVGGKVCVSM